MRGNRRQRLKAFRARGLHASNLFLVLACPPSVVMGPGQIGEGAEPQVKEWPGASAGPVRRTCRLRATRAQSVMKFIDSSERSAGSGPGL